MRNRVILLLVSVAGVLLLHAEAQATTGTVVRLYVDDVRTAGSFKESAAQSSTTPSASYDNEAVALGRQYLHGRLARSGCPFVCTTSAAGADYRLETSVSSLRSSENEFKGPTYGHATKTTTWQLDVLISLLRGDDLLLSKTKTSTYEERRPISEVRFDNNIFHNLMVAALEQAADEVIDYFDEPESDGGSVAVPAPGGVGAVGGLAREGVARAPADPRQPLAILKPEAGAGVSEKEAAQLWDFIESSVTGGAFRVISRSDLPRMQEEIGFTTSSDLVDLASRDRARIGKIKTVSKLLLTSVGRIGETFTLSFKVFDASTAEIEMSRSRTLEARSIDAFLPRLRSLLSEVLAAPPTGTVLIPAAAPLSMPRSVARAFDAELAQTLAAAGVAVKAGTVGGVRIVPSIAAYAVRVVQEGDGFVYRGSVSGSVRVEGADVVPVTFALNDVELGREHGAAPSWLTESYGRKLVAQALKAESVRNWLPSLNNLK